MTRVFFKMKLPSQHYQMQFIPKKELTKKRKEKKKELTKYRAQKKEAIYVYNQGGIIPVSANRILDEEE